MMIVSSIRVVILVYKTTAFLFGMQLSFCQALLKNADICSRKEIRKYDGAMKIMAIFVLGNKILNNRSNGTERQIHTL